MKITFLAILGGGLQLLALGSTLAAQEASGGPGAAAIQASTSDKSPNALLIAGNEGSWSLVSDGKDSRVVAKIGWQSATGAIAFGLDSSASVQKSSPDTTQLLDLDGLAAGDTSVSGQVTFRKVSPLDGEKLKAVCLDVNGEIEKQIRRNRGSLFAEPLRGEACTVDKLNAAGWFEARSLDNDALSWACGELTKANPDVVLVIPNGPLPGPDAPPSPFGQTGECTKAGLLDAIRIEVERRKQLPEYKTAQAAVHTARASVDGLLAKIKANEEAYSRARSADERLLLAVQRQRLDADRIAAEKSLKDSEGKLAALLPDILATKKPQPDPDKRAGTACKSDCTTESNEVSVALEKKRAEMLAAVCKRFNEPDRSAEIRLSPRSTCVLGRIEKSIATLEDGRVRNRLRYAVIANLPVQVWAFTARGGADTKSFSFVDPAKLPGYPTFDELGKGVQSETDHDTQFGVAGTLQRGVHFFRLGYDRRNVHAGGAATQVCAPAAVGSSVSRCANVVLGAPKRSEENVAAAEYRRLMTAKLGLAARVFYLDEAVRNSKPVSDEWEAHLVLYFLANPTKGLNGGLDATYDTVSKDTSVRLFIGRSFSLFE